MPNNNKSKPGGDKGVVPSSPPPKNPSPSIEKPRGNEKHGYQPSSPPPSKPLDSPKK